MFRRQITLLNAGRKYLGVGNDMAGKVFVTAGLGGMSGAQAKAAVLAGCVGVVAEVCPETIKKRMDQGWVLEVERDLDKLLKRVRQAKADKEASGQPQKRWNIFLEFSSFFGETA